MTPRNKAKAFFEEEWRALPSEEAARVMKACSSPIRHAILWLLERHGAIRQYELVGALNKVLRKSLGERYKRYDVASVRHHLKQLERVGLIGFQRSGVREKVIYQKAAMRLQMRPLKPVTLKVEPETLEEAAMVLRKIFGRETS